MYKYSEACDDKSGGGPLGSTACPGEDDSVGALELTEDAVIEEDIVIVVPEIYQEYN